MNIILALNPNPILDPKYLIHIIFYHFPITLYLDPYLCYFFSISPIQNILVTSIHPVSNIYNHKIYH